MSYIEDFFQIEISEDRLTALIYCTDVYDEQLELEFSEADFGRFFRKNNINYGVDQQVIELILSRAKKAEFPLRIAAGKSPTNGTDGEIKYEFNYSSDLVRQSDWDFRQVMQIPSVKKGQKLAMVIEPSDGVDGMSVEGHKLKAYSGKSTLIKAGKNVVYREENKSFYAASDGQLSVVGTKIRINPLFEVKESISMKIGNLDFIGTIIIHGDVPNGFTIKAGGDVKIFGMVEAATVISDGSIFISEGFAGKSSGLIKAKENIRIGYINQGSVYAGNDLYVENSILHSDSVAENQVFCQQGNIIGGSISAGKSVEAKDIGNHLGTKTEIVFGVDKSIQDKENSLLSQKSQLQDALEKLTNIGKKLEAQHINQNASLRISLLRQKNAVQKTKDKLATIEEMLASLQSKIGSENDAELIVRNNLYQNVLVSFGKYKRKIRDDRHYIMMHLKKSEIIIEPLFIES